MKTLQQLVVLLVALGITEVQAQEPEKYGGTLNAGAGYGYYKNMGTVTSPVFHANYEIDGSEYITFAPFIALYTYRKTISWGEPPYASPYHYSGIVIPLGVKGTYYLDRLFQAGSRWDFYVGGSAGITYRSVSWVSGYDGTTGDIEDTGPLFIDVHIGSEYHLLPRIGIFADISTGVSSFGISYHPSLRQSGN